MTWLPPEMTASTVFTIVFCDPAPAPVKEMLADSEEEAPKAPATVTATIEEVELASCTIAPPAVTSESRMPDSTK